MIRFRLIVLLCGVASWATACDSGFSKVSESEPEPEPDEEPEAPADFMLPELDFAFGNESRGLSELDGRVRSLCEAFQNQLDVAYSYFSEEPQLCELLAVADATDRASNNDTFRNRCEDQLSSCLDDGPNESLQRFLPDSLVDLRCDRWATSDDCDPTIGIARDCLEDVVDAIVVPFDGAATCASTRSQGQVTVSSLEELEAETDPYSLTNRCAAVVCLMPVADAGP